MEERVDLKEGVVLVLLEAGEAVKVTEVELQEELEEQSEVVKQDHRLLEEPQQVEEVVKVIEIEHQAEHKVLSLEKV